MKLSYNPVWNMVLFIVAISFIFYFLSQREGRGDRLREKEFAFFNQADIKGRIIKIGTALEITSFTVDNNTHQFIFNPDISKEGSVFSINSEIGDSIMKPAFSPYVLVKGKEETYRYTFKRH